MSCLERGGLRSKLSDIIQFVVQSVCVPGFVWFVLSLVKKYYLRQFSLFAWTHVALLCVVTQSYLIIQNMFQVTTPYHTTLYLTTL